MSRRRPRPLKRRAITALEDAAYEHFGDQARVGRLTYLGQGLARRAWSAPIEAPDGTVHTWVAQVPLERTTPGDLARITRELELLGALTRLELPFAHAAPIASIRVDNVPINVTTACFGVVLNAPDAVVTPEQAATVTAQVAAAIHSIDPEGLPLPDTLHPTRLDDAHSALATVRELDPPFIDEIEAWMIAHLPDPSEPACVLHGDLVGQNILWQVDGPASVLDWEFAGTGDPATDLAIVTGGDRRVFGITHGRQLLLDVYAEHSGHPVSPSDLRLQELGLMADAAIAFIRDYPETADEHLDLLRRLYERPLLP